ncbi:MAG: sulfurtransferase TusA family protein [Phycisphaerales bacterium]|nr:MAG: sulfurtransferase TusA family protein [Phycisphaerales bacterium]
MSVSETVDARGLSCPQPALLTRQALKRTSGKEVTVLVDTATQVQNCTRTAEQLGWQAVCEENEGTFRLRLRR